MTKPDLMAELAACPFCGGGAWVVDVPDTRRFRPQCSKCGADLGEFKRRADAVTAWNTRTHHAELEAAVRDAETLRRVKAMRNEWELDEREHLATFGQHLPASVICMVEKVDQAMRNSAREG